MSAMCSWLQPAVCKFASREPLRRACGWKRKLLPFYTSELRLSPSFLGGTTRTEVPVAAMSVVDIDAERERIRKEIEELEHSLDPEDASIEVIVSGSDLDTDSDSVDISENDEDDSDASLLTEEEKEDGKSDDGVEDKIPACPETCLQINLVYQEVIQEKIEEVALLLAQNKERQEELLWRLSGPRIPKPKKDDVVKPRLFIGSFMKPYFKDKATGCGPPANQDTREKASQGIKSFEELQLSKWKLTEKQLLKDAVMSDSLQHLLQPKLFKHEYLNQKLEKAKDEVSHQILEKQIRETEREIADINQLSEARLLGERTDEHDWDKIANIHFEGNRNADELRKYWQNSEHPSINKEDWSEEEAKTLLEVAASHNYLNWQDIADELGTKRTAFQCLQKYQTYNKDFRRKEWTKGEDQMLTHLVEQMRVGNHIPYQKIAYYMEGRNTFQLIYRWTKSVDPNLKKGPWSKEEDAKLLKAISRYGERDWYKIRDEVPHRSDAQCRDRYHNSLNAKFKKGRWTHTEKAKLMALVDKYGPGHWSKIASELPNRTDSQCLSRWKMSMGLRFYQRKSGKKREIFSESPEETEEEEEEEDDEFSLESSEESMDEMELQLDDSSEDEMVPHKITRQPKYSKPPIDLWVPTREHIGALRNKLFAETLSNMRRPFGTSKKDVAKSVPPATQNDDSMRHPSGNVGRQVVHAPSNLNTILKGFACSHVTHISTEDPTELLKEAFNAGKYILKVEAEDVKGILKRNTFFLRKKLEEKRARRLNKISDMYQISPGMSLDQVRDVLQAAKRQTMPGFHKTRSLRTGELDRKLYMAVSPWVGNVIVIYSLTPGNVLKRGTQADAIKEELQKVHLATTPVFKFLLQLFRIDADGCLQVIRAATAPPTAPQPDPLVTSPGKSHSLVQQPASHQNSTGPSLEYIPPKSSPLLLGSQPVTDIATPAIQTPKGDVAVAGKRTPSTASFRRPHAPKDKPKTVLELLREKRMKACQSSSSEIGLKDAATTGVTPQPLSGQKVQQGSIKPQTPSSSPNQSSLLHSQKVPLAAPLTVIPLDSSTGTSKSAACSPPSQGTGADALKQDNQSVSCGGTPVSHSDSSSEPAASSQAQKGESLASSSLPEKADVPRQVPTTSSVEKDISQTVAKGMPAKAATKPPITTVGSTAPIYIQPPLLNLLPTVLPTQGGPQNVIRNIMPYTFVLTPQTLVSVPLQTLLGLSGANQQATLSTTGLYAPAGNPVPLLGSSNSNVSPSSVLPVVDNANSNVISHTDAASSPLVETSSKSPGEGQVAVKSFSAVMSSTNTGTLVSTTTPVLTPSSSSPNMSTTLSSKEILTASPGESRGSNPGSVPSSNPGSVPSSADISTVVPSAELLCSLSLISLSKGGASEPDEPSSFQKEAAVPLEKRPSQHMVPETVVRASTRLLTIGTKRMATTAKPALRKSIIVPSRPLVCIAPRLPGTPTLTITDRNKIRKPVSIAARNPTMPTLYSANKNLNLQQPSISVSTLATPPLSTTVTNQTLSSASIVMRAMALPHLPCTAKNQNPSFTSVAVKTLGMPPPSNASTNQNPPPVSVATTTLAMPPPSSTATSPNLLPASMSVLPTPPVTSADTIQNLPPASMSVLPKPPVTSANTIQNLPPASMSVLPTPPVTSADTIQNLPPASMSVLPKPPVTSANTIQNLPPASMSVLPTPPVTSANTIQNLPPASMSVLPKPPVTSANTIQNLPPASMSFLPKPPVTSAGTIQNLPPASVALGSLSMPPPSSTGTNQNLSAASIALRSPSMPRLTSIVNHQNQSPVSVAVRNLTMPPPSSTANKQHRPPVFIPVRNLKTPTSTYGNQKLSPIASPEKKKVDFSLVSLEEEAKVKGWFRGERGVQVPPLRNGFPYLPPSVCNLKTLSKLLQKKKALEKNVASLLPSKGDNDEQVTEEQLQAVQDMVGQRLKDNPAYLLLKARFLSAFTLPAFLATLAPPKVHTTVRASRHMYGDSDEEEEEENTVRDYDEMDTTDDELKESEHREDNPENQLSEMPLDSSTETFEVTQVAAPFNQEHPVEETLSQETLNNSPTVIEEDTPAPIRRSARLRKKVKK